MYDISLTPHELPPEELLLRPSWTYFLVAWDLVLGLAMD